MLLRVRAWVSRHRLRIAVAAVLIGVAGGLSLGIATGTRRTGSAPDRYTRYAGGDADLVITQQSGPALQAQVAALPGVRLTRAVVFVPSFLVSPLDGSLVFEANPFAGDDDINGARVVAGRFTDPSQPNEFVVNRVMASLLKDRFGTGVGDTFQVASYDQAQVAANFDALTSPAVAPFSAMLVGVTESPTDFDESSPQMVFSRSFLAAHPDVGVVQTIMSVYLDDGVDPRAVLDKVHQMPHGEDAFLVPQRVVSDSARRAVRFQVTALWLVSALSFLAAAAVIAQVVSRTVRISDDERRSILALGWQRHHLAAERMIEGGIVAVLAAPIAAVVAYAVTSRFPIGVLRLFEPEPGARVDWPLTVLGVLAIGGVVTTTAAVVGLRRPVGAAARRTIGGLASRVSSRGSRLPLAVGACFASAGARGRKPWGSRVAGTVGVAGLVGASVVGLSLTRIIDNPARWGVNFDALFGNPFTDAPGDVVALYRDSPLLIDVTGANIGSVTIDGSETATIGFDSAKGDLAPTVLRGRDPIRPNEIGIGAEVARRLRADLGDTVEVVGTGGEPSRFTVVGIVVTPDSAGNGAAMTFDEYERLNPGATENIVLANYRDGVTRGEIEELHLANYTPPDSLTTPTSVRALERVTAAPLVLGIVLAVLLFVGCAYLLATSVRARHRDLAILRALGSDSRQLRAVVHFQGSLVAVTITIAGIPLGIILGRWIITLLTDALGIVPGALVPIPAIAAFTVGPLLVANGLAVLPARRASHVRLTQLTVDR